MSSTERPSAVVVVQPLLLADALRRMLEVRGLDVTIGPDGQPGQVDVVVANRPVDITAAHVVITLPQEPGEKGTVHVDGRKVDLEVEGVADLDLVLTRFLP